MVLRERIELSASPLRPFVRAGRVPRGLAVAVLFPRVGLLPKPDDFVLWELQLSCPIRTHCWGPDLRPGAGLILSNSLGAIGGRNDKV